MGVDVKIKPRLKVVSRLRVLHYVVHELASGFGVGEGALKTIKKGILDKQIIERIWINYLNSEGKLVGRVIITIDWERHRVRASSENGKSFQIDSSESISISEQISRVYSTLVKHTEKLRKAFGVEEIKVRYSYTHDIWEDEKELQKAREFLGTSPGKNLEWADVSHWDIEIEYISRKLEELRVKIEHNKPK